jgi:hypothetical protein
MNAGVLFYGVAMSYALNACAAGLLPCVPR